MDYKLIENFIRYFEDKTFDVMYNENKKGWSNVKLPENNEIAISKSLYSKKNNLENIAMEICDKYASEAAIPSNPKLLYLDGIVNAVVKQVIEYTHIENITDIQPYMMPVLRKIVYRDFTFYPNSTGDSKNKAQPKQLKRIFQLLGYETIYNGVEILQRMMPTPIVNTFYSKFRTLLRSMVKKQTSTSTSLKLSSLMMERYIPLIPKTRYREKLTKNSITLATNSARMSVKSLFYKHC